MRAENLPLTISDLSLAYRRRELSPVEVTEALLERAAALQPALNAFITITADEALAQARLAEQRLLHGGPAPLLGIPITLKDLVDQNGVVTTAGHGLRRQTVATADAMIVQRLFRAGAISLGKTNTHEFAYSFTCINPHFGDVHNPWDVSRVPGGSSGGAGAAVATGIGIVGIGTDTGGSIRVPAALCGVVGLKPTYGRVPKAGVFPLSTSLDHVGPLSRTVADAAVVLSVIAGEHPSDPTSVQRPVDDYIHALREPVARLRVGVVTEHLEGLAADVAKAIDDALDVLRRLGVRVRPVEWPTLPLPNNAIVGAEGAAIHRAAFAAQPEAFGEDVQGFIRAGLAVRGVDYVDSLAALQRSRREVSTLFDGVDLLVGPTVAQAALTIEQSAALARADPGLLLRTFGRLTRPYNLTGLPAISVPCGFSSEGLPIGLQIAGRPFDESTILRLAHSYEQATDWHLRRPAQ